MRRLGPMAGGGFGGQGPGGFTFTTDNLGDLGDLFGNLFNRGRGRGRPGAASAGPQRGADLETELQLSFEGAVQGVTTTVNITSDVACHTCHGSGAKPGTMPQHLPALWRSRRARREPGLLLVQPAVPAVRRRRNDHRRAVPDLPRLGHRVARPPGQGPHPRRCAGRPAHPSQGSRRPRPQRRPERRPVRRSPASNHIRCSAVEITTSRSRCRSRSRKPRSAPR